MIFGKVSPKATLSIVKEEDQIISKLGSYFSHEETKKMAKNCIGLNILFCGLDSNEFNPMFGCGIAKDIWNILKTTYEGTGQVRESKISLYVHCCPKKGLRS